jgi:hypothetical protein
MDIGAKTKGGHWATTITHQQLQKWPQTQTKNENAKVIKEYHTHINLLT